MHITHDTVSISALPSTVPVFKLKFLYYAPHQKRQICVYVTVPGKRVLVAQIMIFLYRRFSATTPKNNSRDKTFVFVSEVSPTLCLHSR